MNQFDVDLVYLWVDGNDPAWLTKKNQFLGKEAETNTDATTIARTADNDELLYSLRSVEKYAPWIRKIFIVTDEQKPAWLNIENPKIQLVDIREILPSQALPCYNSVVIEYFLWKIPNLAEHFLYANDDMFFNVETTPDFFFGKNNYPIVRLQRSFMGKKINRFKKRFNINNNIYRKTIDKAATLIEKKFGKYYSGTPHHNIDAYIKTDYQDVVVNVFNNEITSTVTNHIRSENDVQRIIFLYYALATKHGYLKYVGRRESCRIRVHKPDFMWFIQKYNPKLFCLNDHKNVKESDRKRIRPFLQTLFPEKSSFEK